MCLMYGKHPSIAQPIVGGMDRDACYERYRIPFVQKERSTVKAFRRLLIMLVSTKIDLSPKN